jgi:hypothetical protein
VALSIVDATTRATIGNGAVIGTTPGTGGSVSLEASSASDVTTTAKGGSGGDVAITPVVGIAIVHNTVEATVGTGSLITVAGGFSAAAAHEGAIVTKAEGNAEAADVAVGASLGLTYVEDVV